MKKKLCFIDIKGMLNVVNLIIKVESKVTQTQKERRCCTK